MFSFLVNFTSVILLCDCPSPCLPEWQMTNMLSKAIRGNCAHAFKYNHCEWKGNKVLFFCFYYIFRAFFPDSLSVHTHRNDDFAGVQVLNLRYTLTSHFVVEKNLQADFAIVVWACSTHSLLGFQPLQQQISEKRHKLYLGQECKPLT